MVSLTRAFRVGEFDALRLFQRAFPNRTERALSPQSVAEADRLSRQEVEALLDTELLALRQLPNTPGKSGQLPMRAGAAGQPFLLTRDLLTRAAPQG